MINEFEYQPRGVCSSRMIIKVNVGGCPGNSQGVAKLCIGRTIDEVIELLNGIDCRGRGTSCPDQLAKALVKLKEELLITN